MAYKIFYSWQSSTRGKFNRYFLKECLEEAIARLTAYYQNNVEFYLDHDTKDVPGYPNIVQAIQKKVQECDLYVADISVIGRMTTGKGVLNPNVQNELGLAMGTIGQERIILIMNEAYGNPAEENLVPFDLAQYRYPFTYNYAEANDDPKVRKSEKEKLVNKLLEAIQLIYDTENERQKKEFDPFETWKTWEAGTPKSFDYETSEYILKLFNSLHENIKIPGSLTRVLGLSGLGKTKLLLECFRPGNGIGMTTDICDKVLYANMNLCDENEVTAKVKELFRNHAKKIIILDNCSLSMYEKVRPTIQSKDCGLSLITISPEPNESQQEVDLEGKTLILKLDAKEYLPIVKTLLEKNFAELTAEDIALFVDYSNGLPFYAELMANNSEVAKQQPGSLTNTNILSKLLGPLYNDKQNKLIITATAVFSRFGYIKDHEKEYQAIALSQALCPMDESDPELRIRKFREVCEEMRGRGLLEDIGFSLSFRPTPLALRLAEEWWRTCTVNKFKEVLPVLKENKLVEKFCQQFRLLQHIAHAQEIVANLCDGVFNSAEVLNTEEGSRIFRSFVNVNPPVCARTLTTAFGHLNKKELEEVDEGRRNLVWSLEQLCFRGDTFDPAIKIMASFAIAENENISNNATQQFLQLFHIFLPGTIVNLQRRWEIIEYCLNRDQDYFSLGMNAAIRALKSDHFIRMGGAVSEGELEDYRPAYGEIMDYWSKAISLLEKIAEDPAYSDRIHEVFVNSMFGLCAQNAGKLILPVIYRLLERGIIHWLKIRNNIKLILRSGKVYEEAVIEDLEKMLQNITPNDFSARLQMYVVQPSSEDYFSDDPEQEGNVLPHKIKELAIEFAAHPQQWDQGLTLLTTSPVSEGISFGKELGTIITHPDEAETLIDLLLQKVASLKPEQRNISVLMGFLRSLSLPAIITQTFEKTLSTKELQFLSFNIASNTDLPYPNLLQLIDLVEQGTFDITALNCFNYGWGLKHLSYEQSLVILQRISGINDQGKVLAFSIAYTWSYNDKEAWQSFRGFFRGLLLTGGVAILETFTRSQEFFYWSEAARKLLREQNDPELAVFIIQLIIEKNNDWDSSFSYRTDFYNLLDVLQANYFNQLWDGLQKVYLQVEEFSAAAFHFKDLLGAKHDYHAQTEGLIFKDNPRKFEIVFDWAKAHADQNLYWIAEWLPVFNKEDKAASKWHPYALQFIDQLGAYNWVLSGISAKIGTYSWVGSVLGRYVTLKSMFGELLNHPIPQVRNWAEAHLKDTEARIEWEKNHESEMGF